ncbi:MAG: gamma-glutamyl-gamma-aminobutyrate hydrolase family protein [Oscillospiraceae bacterium]
MKPLIGITMNYVPNESVGLTNGIGTRQQKWDLLAEDYITAVERAGGMPVLLPICEMYRNDGEILSKLDGILFSGGDDVNPMYYNEPCDVATGLICPERDEQELFLIKKALKETDMPVFCICRGIQLFNVAAGGSLYQGMDPATMGSHLIGMQPMRILTHPVEVKEGSMLEKIVGKNPSVNSFHHQCIKALGEGVECVAKDPHGVVEAIEMPARKAFTLGVQWHPEGLVKDFETHQNLFNAFVKAATK